MEAELMALAAAGATALVQQMATDGWSRARDRVVRFLAARGSASAESVEADLEETRADLVAARQDDDEETADDLRAELRSRLHRTLRADPAAAGDLRALLDGAGVFASSPAPAHQLPLEDDPFENRHPQRDRVRHGVEERQRYTGPVRPLTFVLSGVGGIGKTALAVRLAHELKSDFTAGYVDLDEWRTAGSVDLAAVLRDRLVRLGVAENWLPEEYRALVRLYERKTQGARLVLVLDNVWSADEVTTLLPVSADSVVLIAARERLPRLEARGAIGLPLPRLSDDHAVDLLRKIISPVRPDESPQALVRLARLCEGFPAALRAAGSHLCEHPGRRTERLIADLTSELDERGLPVVEAVWNATYEALAAPAAQLYRLLPRHPGHDITPEAAAALLGAGLDDAEDALDDLTRAGLLAPSPPHRPGRLRLHGLLRAHATRCASRHDDPAETHEGLRRLLVWYRRQAERADRTIARSRMRLADPVPELPYAPDVTFTHEADARGWLDTERRALYGFVRTASDLGEDTHAWSLCEPLWKHYEDHGNHDDAIRAFGAGRDAALRCELPDVLIRMRCQLAQALWSAGRSREADTETEQALRSAESVVRDSKLHASALEFRGKYFARTGQWDGAVECFGRSRAIHLAIGNPYGALLQGFLLGRTLRTAGRLAEAESELTGALDQARELDRSRVIARSAAELGRVRRALGRPDQAVAALREALAVEERRGSTYDEATLHEELAELARETGDTEAAEEHRARARALRDQAGVGTDD
ncbi:tetratricopeptide repeat protein [Streptomyces sp. NPDC051569]|uniref:tetratricopeptide repeat protein n=1 Tax=Streptomyces sp. NPDC051569 TaxID=3365661 RepID=UPI0037BC3ABD